MRKFIARLLAWLLEALDPQIASLHFVVNCGTSTHKATQMNTTITDTGTATLIAACVSAAGNAVPSSAITWTSSDESIVTITPGATSDSVIVAATGKLGAATVTAAAGNLTATDEITVVVGPAVTLTLTEAPAA